MKLNVGDYVRTKKGQIFKITAADIEFASEIGSDGELPFDAKVISPNIIDLIEVGDYVNGNYIQEIKEIKNNEMTCMLDSDYEFYSHIKNEDIKSILTREQFESMEYKVEIESD